MSKIILSKTAGFCFGVDRAIKMLFEIIDKTNKEIYTLGPIIHNPQIIKELEEKGVKCVNSVFDVPDDALLVIRTHGIPDNEKRDILNRNLEFTDMTCPYVEKIQNIVKKASDEGKYVLIAGDPEHPEVIGIKGYCDKNKVVVFKSPEDLIELENNGYFNDKDVIIVAQTTYNTTEWEKICVHLNKKLYTKLTKFDTICNATKERQDEASRIAEQVDLMIVIGGKNSSNTTKLYEICKSKCHKTYHIETAKELPYSEIKSANLIGVTAGASTPDSIIKEVIKEMEEIKNNNIDENKDEIIDQTDDEINADDVLNDVSENEEINAEDDLNNSVENEENYLEVGLNDTSEYEELQETNAETDKNSAVFLEAMETLKTLHTGELVKATVLSVQPNEVHLDLGIKHTGIMPLSEISDEVINLEEKFKVGQEIEAQIIRMNDVEGTVTLSLKRIEALKVWTDLEKVKETGDILNGTVSTAVNGGIIVNYKGIRVFIPASHSSVSRETNLDDLIGTGVKFKIIEVENSGKRRKVIGSIRLASKDERKVSEDKIWTEIEVGKQYKGTVKSLTTYGAFIDIGGIDGMVHISELSWSRIKHPSEILNVGDIVSVYIKDIDREGKRISLGYKNAEDNPWEVFKRDYKAGAIVDVKIVKLMPYGAFAQVIPGIDGLIHISELSNERVNKTSDVVKVGETVKVKILEIDNKNRISLSIRALIPEPERIEPLDEINEIVATTETKEEIKEEKAEVVAEVKDEAIEEVKEKAVKETKAKKAKEEKPEKVKKPKEKADDKEKTEKAKKAEPKEKKTKEKKADEGTKEKKTTKTKKTKDTVSE